MTIQELLVRDGKWSTVSGPTPRYVGNRCTYIDMDEIKKKCKPGKWVLYTMSVWIYVPSDKADTLYFDNAMLTENTK